MAVRMHLAQRVHQLTHAGCPGTFGIDVAGNARRQQPQARHAAVMEQVVRSTLPIFQVIDQPTMDGFDPERSLWRRLPQVAVHQHGGVLLLEGDRDGEVAGDMAGTAACGDRCHEHDQGTL